MNGATTIQERLKDLRLDKGLKLEELAEQTGISKSALGSYEKDDYKEINHGNLILLADFYGVSLDYLFCRTENRAEINTPLRINGGVIVMIEGLRGFVPASKLSLSYIEDLETYLLKEIEVQVIDADQANNRLVLSARELLKEKEKKAREDQIANLKIGEVLEGTVETLQNYGAFIKLDNGLSGLVHVSQISQKRVKLPSDVLNAGDKVTVKVIGIKDGKISLSMKALEEVKEEPTEKVVIPKSENIGTNLGDLFKNIQL